MKQKSPIKEDKPESMVTTLEEDRKFLAEKWEERISCGECFDYRVRPCPNCIGHHRFISRLLTAKERVVRSECAEIVLDNTTALDMGKDEYHVQRKVLNEILNNSSL